ncbi:hypothetical protein EMIT0210MI2_10608 [Priestia megaterium]
MTSKESGGYNQYSPGFKINHKLSKFLHKLKVTFEMNCGML